MYIIGNNLFRIYALPLLLLIAGTTFISGAEKAESDTVGMSKKLDEIVVMAPSNITIGNKTVYFPNKELKNATNSCVQLLSGLQIPELIVNPATGDVTISGNSKLSIRINGREVNVMELASISSKDIAKVEYLSNPGGRYGDADAVLDIIVKRRDDGFGVMLNLLQSPNRGWGNYTAALKFNVGKSEWTVDYTSNPMWEMDCYRDNSEYIKMYDGTYISRYESGQKEPNRMVTHHASLQYSYAVGNNMSLNIQARLLRQNDKNVSAGDVTTEIDGKSVTGFEREMSLVKRWQGDIDVYLYYKINRRNKVYFNIVPTVISGSNDRTYESTETLIASDIDNRSFHLIAEGIWEVLIGNGKLSSGVRTKYSNDKALYRLSGDMFRERSTHNYLFTEWAQSIDRLQYAIGIGGTVYSISRPVSYMSAFVNPRLSVRYQMSEHGAFSLAFNTVTVPPAINSLNPIMQQVDMFQWAKGNTSLKSFQRYEQQVAYDAAYNEIFVKGSIRNRYCRNPIMGLKIYEDGNIVGSYCNAGYNNDLEIKAILRMPLLIHQLTLSMEGGWHTTVSKGLDYRHRYSQPFVNAQLMFMSNPWWVMVKYNSTYNSLWGEMITSANQNLLNIGIGYTYRKATFMAGVVNPLGIVSLRTENLNAIAGYDRTYRASGSGQLVWVGMTLNLHQGRKRAKLQKKLDNTTIYESINNTMK